MADIKEEEAPVEIPEPIKEPENEITLDLGGVTETQPAKVSGEEVSMTIETPVPDPVPPFHEKAAEPVFEIEATEMMTNIKVRKRNPIIPV